MLAHRPTWPVLILQLVCVLLNKKMILKLGSSKPLSKEEIFLQLLPRKAMDVAEKVNGKQSNTKQNKKRKPKMKLNNRRHLPNFWKDDQVGNVDGKAVVVIRFYQMPCLSAVCQPCSPRYQVPSPFLPQPLPLFPLNSQFHFVLFCFLAHFLCTPFSLSFFFFNKTVFWHPPPIY